MIARDKQPRYPVGIQTFSEIIEGGYVYVDKTADIGRLIWEGKYYFLSRPRRFGKSLLLSTIEAYYRGRRDLFKGLALDTLTDDWEPHPILHLDLNADEYDRDTSLNVVLDLRLREWEAQYGITPVAEATLSYRFGAVIAAACAQTSKKVVILIDEYDKPMLNAIENEPLADRFRSILKAFYSNLKKMDRYIEFAMLTGVARFSKVSIFSDLNNLRDISFEPAYSTICGITPREVDRCFGPGIEVMAHAGGVSSDEIRLRLREHYDGYHFAEDLRDVYNPYSLVRAFASGSLDNYWSRSGTPSYIVRLLQKSGWRLREIEGYRVKASQLAAEGIMTDDPIPSLFQAGYITIKGFDPLFRQYILGYPNKEVEESFIDFLLPMFLGPRVADNEFDISLFVQDIYRGRPREFMARLGSLLNGLPNPGPGYSRESHFQNAIYLIFKMVGFYATLEDHTSTGRIDLTVMAPGYIYLFEFKIDRSARAAMEQIHEKRYWLKYEASGKTIFLIGANFDRDKRTLDDIILETIQPVI